VIATLYFTDRREARKLKHDAAMKLRDDRLKGYATMARLTKGVDPEEPYQSKDLADASAEIELLTGNPDLKQAADDLLRTMLDWRGEATKWYEKGHKTNLYSIPSVRQARDAVETTRAEFIRLAKEETQPLSLRRRRSHSLNRPSPQEPKSQ
jgi:hypothetical protein